MQKYWLVIFIFFVGLVFSGCTIIDEQLTDASLSQQDAIVPSAQPSSSPTSVFIDFTARFEIYTNGTKRTFADAKYHRQSTDIYIENPDPHLVNVKKQGLTWNDFFSTLPFSLKKECLVTGTKQTFCNTETKRLYFYRNGQEDPDALDRVIAPNDVLRVEYR